MSLGGWLMAIEMGIEAGVAVVTPVGDLDMPA
jgi:hypothetical protein